MIGSTTHSTIITFDFAKPISSSRSISRVGDLVAMASLDVLGEQIVEVRLDEADLADLAAARERLLDRGVDHRVSRHTIGEADPPFAGPAFGRGAELGEIRGARRRRRELELDLE